MQAKLVDAGIDYLRVTSQDRKRQEQMFEYFRNIAVMDEKQGYEVKPGGVFGFWGKKSRHALWGVRNDWALVQSTGRFAKAGLKMAMSGIQASRIDIQMTYRLESGEVSEAVREAYEDACMATPGAHRPRAVKLIEERHKAQTVYIGKRSSDIFVRIYDKFQESGKVEYERCIRFEVEIKGRAAKQLWNRMALGSDGIGFLLHLLYEVLRERGITLPEDNFDNAPSMVFKKEPTADESRIAWLARSVAPTVSKLSETYGWIMSFSVLFEKALTEFDKRRIMQSLAFCWGS